MELGVTLPRLRPLIEEHVLERQHIVGRAVECIVDLVVDVTDRVRARFEEYKLWWAATRDLKLPPREWWELVQ